ncbi:MAG: hypothetical protein KJ058_09935 [Thermoanaerobaculia bacterium]|nr:hypothetical protein [Thermoanaerobaculia bacterium]
MPRLLVNLASLLLLVSSPTLADYVQTLTGTNEGGPTWQRPETTNTLSGNCTACRYAVQPFVLESASSCVIVSAQDYDGHIALYRGSFNPAAPFLNLVDLDDDGELGVGTSRIPADLDASSVNLTTGAYYLVSSAFSNSGAGSFTHTVHCASAQPIQGGCFFAGTPKEKNVCLFDRFVVFIDQVSGVADGIATPVRFGSKETSFFWFYTDQNFEVMVKVLDACFINGRYWVFTGALTNQGYRIRVGDVLTQQVRTYNNPAGTNAGAVSDTVGFPCNP